MIRLGLCSRALITRDIRGVIAAASAAGLDAIEWAADSHVGAEDISEVEATMIATLRAGLTVASYATLYRAGSEDRGLRHFDGLLRAASALQAPIMRIYVCRAHDVNRVSRRDYGHPLDEDPILARLAEELRGLGDRAARKGITLGLSMGRGTCLDGYDRAIRLASAASHDFVRLAWEDLPGAPAEEANEALERAGGLVGALVASSASRDGSPRKISGDIEAWRRRIGAFKRAEMDPKMSSFVLLGATRVDGAEGAVSLAEDGRALRALIDEAEPKKPR